MKKEFDAVKSMREIRKKLNKKYSKDPGLRKQRLKKIQQEYDIQIQTTPVQNVSDTSRKMLYQNKN